jgi:threonine/homoserine/homoserine lactone efflux protein
MIDLSTLATFAAVVLGLFLIPGPAVLMVLGRAASGGRTVGVATGLGIATGDLGHALMATFGLSALLMTSALAFQTVKYVGAAYLVFLGIRAFFEKTGPLRIPGGGQIPGAASSSASRAYRQGILAELLNPKTALFFLAFLPQFVHAGHGPVMAQLATLGLIFAAMSAVYTSLIALGGGAFRRLLERNRTLGRWQGKAIGTLYIALGARLALQER